MLICHIVVPLKIACHIVYKLPATLWYHSKLLATLWSHSKLLATLWYWVSYRFSRLSCSSSFSRITKCTILTLHTHTHTHTHTHRNSSHIALDNHVGDISPAFLRVQFLPLHPSFPALPHLLVDPERTGRNIYKTCNDQIVSNVQ